MRGRPPSVRSDREARGPAPRVACPSTFTSAPLSAPALAALSLLSVSLLAGCRDYAEDRCREICDCQGCSEVEEEDCLVQTQAALDVASAYECEAEAEAYLDCEMEKFRCFDDTYQLLGSTCGDVRGELFNCTEDASKRSGGPYNPPGL